MSACVRLCLCAHIFQFCPSEACLLLLYSKYQLGGNKLPQSNLISEKYLWERPNEQGQKMKVGLVRRSEKNTRAVAVCFNQLGTEL